MTSTPNTLLARIPSAAAAIAVFVLLVLGTLGVRSWLAARDAATQLAATVATQKQLLAQAAAREQQRDTALAATLATITQAKAKVQTPTEAAAQIPTILPQLPAPVIFDLPTPPKNQSEPNTAAPAEASIPQADLKPIYDYLQDCRACQAKLTAAQGDLADERSKVTALTTERDAAIKAARGGSFWSRVRSGIKWFAIGAAAGAAAASAVQRGH